MSTCVHKGVLEQCLFNLTIVIRQRFEQGSEVGIFAFSFCPRGSPSFALAQLCDPSLPAFVATMPKTAPSVRSANSSRKSAAKKRVAKKGASLEKANTDSVPEASERKGLPPGASGSTQVVGSGGGSAFEALPNVRQGASPKTETTSKKKNCAFLCGSVCFETPDLVDPQRSSIRWAYDKIFDLESNGIGANCWCCERTWSEHAHETGHRERGVFQAHLAKDRSALEVFLKSREALIQRAQKQKGAREKRAGGLSQVTVGTKRFKKQYLDKPADDFWPLSRYRKRFGSPSRKENKILGHRKCVYEGYEGVMAPGDDGVGPWKVKTHEGREIAMQEAEDVGSSGGEEELAAAKFASLKKADDENFAAVAQGAMSSILQGFELNEEERKEEEGRIARRQAMRRKGKKNAACAQDSFRKRKVNARFFESDDEDAVAAGAKAEAKQKASRRGKGGSGPRASDKKIPAEPHPGPPEAGALVAEAQGQRKRAGAPKKTAEEVMQQNWEEFARATKHSLFFSVVSDLAEVKRRLLVRWGNSARAQAASAKTPERRQALESCAKRFQIMDDCVKIHRAWHLRGGDTAKAYIELSNSWVVLETFAASAPAERILSDFMHNFVLELKAIYLCCCCRCCDCC